MIMTTQWSLNIDYQIQELNKEILRIIRISKKYEPLVTELDNDFFVEIMENLNELTNILEELNK